jgi:hypothetical protein
VGIRCAEHATLYPQRLALTSPTSGGRSVAIVRLRTKATEFSLVFTCILILQEKLYACYLTNKIYFIETSSYWLQWYREVQIVTVIIQRCGEYRSKMFLHLQLPTELLLYWMLFIKNIYETDTLFLMPVYIKFQRCLYLSFYLSVFLGNPHLPALSSNTKLAKKTCGKQVYLNWNTTSVFCYVLRKKVLRPRSDSFRLFDRDGSTAIHFSCHEWSCISWKVIYSYLLCKELILQIVEL